MGGCRTPLPPPVAFLRSNKTLLDSHRTCPAVILKNATIRDPRKTNHQSGSQPNAESKSALNFEQIKIQNEMHFMSVYFMHLNTMTRRAAPAPLCVGGPPPRTQWSACGAAAGPTNTHTVDIHPYLHKAITICPTKWPSPDGHRMEENQKQ